MFEKSLQGIITADGACAAFPPSAAVAAAIQDCANSALARTGSSAALKAAIAALEGVEKEQIHTTCCSFAILMRDKVVDQRRLLRPTMTDPAAIYLRDFSRFSLLGVNACYCIAPKQTVERLDALGIPAPDRCACAAATAAIKDPEQCEKLIAATEKLREDTVERLEKLGYPCAAGEGPWVDVVAKRPYAFQKEMLTHGVAVAVESGKVRIWMCPPEELERVFFILEKEKTLRAFSVR